MKSSASNFNWSTSNHRYNFVVRQDVGQLGDIRRGDAASEPHVNPNKETTSHGFLSGSASLDPGPYMLSELRHDRDQKPR